MNFSSLKDILMLVAIVTIAPSCVSIDISESNIKKAKGVTYTAPGNGFQEVPSTDVDKAWRNESNGNTITFISDCENPYDPSLENIESGVISGLQNLKKISTSESMYNHRASRRSTFIGSVDGIPSKVSLVIFKKNNCIFVLSYLAIVENFNHDSKQFENFLKGFKAP